MTISPINVGAIPDDGTGDPLREAFQKTNANVAELVAQIATKADDAATTTALAGKANLEEMTTALAGKADAQTTEQALAQKANTADVQEALDLKANTADVDAALALKANALDVQNALEQMPGEAPDDGKQYARQNKAWTEVQSGGGTGTTNLGVANRTADTLDVTSSTGTAATLPSADEAQAGLMSAAQVQRLGGVGLQTVSVFDADPQNSAPVVQLRGGNMDTYDEGGVRWPHGTYNVDLIAPHDPAILGDVEVSMPDETGTMATREWVLGNVPMGNMFEYIEQNCDRSNIMVGTVPLDGQQISDASYPDAIDAVRSGKQKAVTEAVWQADPTKRFMWSLGGGSGSTAWVRPPDLNGVQAGSLRPAYIRGAATDAEVGAGHNSAMEDHAHVMLDQPYLSRSLPSTGSEVNAYGSTTKRSGSAIGVLTGTVLVSNETRGVGAHYLWTVRVFGTVSNPGAVNAAQLATDLAAANAKISALEANTLSTIVYPNGGSAPVPANAAINSRYVFTNPFPGKHVSCIAEILVGGIWAETGFVYAGTGGLGVSAGQISTTQCAVQTGSIGLSAPANHGGSPNAFITTNITGPTPFRVNVSVIGAII